MQICVFPLISDLEYTLCADFDVERGLTDSPSHVPVCLCVCVPFALAMCENRFQIILPKRKDQHSNTAQQFELMNMCIVYNLKNVNGINWCDCRLQFGCSSLAVYYNKYDNSKVKHGI